MTAEARTPAEGEIAAARIAEIKTRIDAARSASRRRMGEIDKRKAELVEQYPVLRGRATRRVALRGHAGSSCTDARRGRYVAIITGVRIGTSLVRPRAATPAKKGYANRQTPPGCRALTAASRSRRDRRHALRRLRDHVVGGVAMTAAEFVALLEGRNLTVRGNAPGRRSAPVTRTAARASPSAS